MDDVCINIYSEIGKLKTVLLHRPGEEIENLTPNYLSPLLFDDIPFLKVAQEEHDKFAKVLRDNGVNVIYLEDLIYETLQDDNVRIKFIDEIIKECKLNDKEVEYRLKNYLINLDTKMMINKVMAGVRKKDMGMSEDDDEYPFLMYPMPNLYFTRDPFSSIGRGITLNSMKTKTRRRETIFAKYIFKYHENFRNSGILMWYNRNNKYNLEGGDELVLSKDILAVGHSARTDKEAILEVARNIFKADESFKTILIFEIPKSRAFMHLDTVFTMIDYDKFTVHEGIEGYLKIHAVSYDYKNNDIVIKEEEDTLQKILSKYLHVDPKFIKCGGGDKIISGREQWNDGSNTLAISPGVVITYERNYVTNEILDKNNVKVLTIQAGELSRGRGGPRCMSMPIFRENI